MYQYASNILARGRDGERHKSVCLLLTTNEASVQISDRFALVGIRERTSRFIYEAEIVALSARVPRVPCEYERENFDINQQRVATITIIQRVRVPLQTNV